MICASLIYTLAYPCEPRSDLVQVLNISDTHWVCVSTKDCRPGSVKVYNSLQSGDLPLSAKLKSLQP